MDTNSVTQYSVVGAVGTATGQDTISIEVSSGSGITDDAALALAAAIKAVPWPAGVTCSVWVTKTVQTAVNTTGDLNANPPVFL